METLSPRQETIDEYNALIEKKWDLLDELAATEISLSGLLKVLRDEE